MSAAEAIAEFSAAADPYGWQVVIPRGIEPNNRALPQDSDGGGLAVDAPDLVLASPP